MDELRGDFFWFVWWLKSTRGGLYQLDCEGVCGTENALINQMRLTAK